MDQFGKRVRGGRSPRIDDSSGWALTGPSGLTVAPIPGGQVERRQQREGAHLSQTVEIRRRDGSVWTAYARQVALPTDPGEADRSDEAGLLGVLTLLAQAVAAADTARQARGYARLGRRATTLGRALHRDSPSLPRPTRSARLTDPADWPG